MTPEAINLTIRAMDERMEAVYSLAEKVATLSTAVLAFTVTFAKNNLPQSAHGYPITIKMSWLGFLVAVLGSFLVQHSRAEFHKRSINAMRTAGTQFTLVTPHWSFHIGRWMVGGGFILGMVLLVAYGCFSA